MANLETSVESEIEIESIRVKFKGQKKKEEVNLDEAVDNVHSEENSNAKSIKLAGKIVLGIVIIIVFYGLLALALTVDANIKTCN